MPLLVAFASLPFGIRERSYTVSAESGPLTVHVSEQQFSPLIAVGTQPSAEDPSALFGDDVITTTYTWYDHPFVLRVMFGGITRRWARLTLPPRSFDGYPRALISTARKKSTRHATCSPQKHWRCSTIWWPWCAARLACTISMISGVTTSILR